MEQHKHDVIVIGAGPIGSYTAYLLSKEGINVGLFEKNDSIGENVNCSGIISKECYDRFRLPEKTVIRPINKIKAYSPSGNYIQYNSEDPVAYIVDRSNFDREINKKAVKTGVVTYLGSKVKYIKNTQSSFRIGIVSKQKEEEYIAQAGIIATGFEFNNLFYSGKKPADFLFGVQTEADFEDSDNVEVFFGKNIAPGSFSWVIPSVKGYAKIGMLVKNKPVDCLKNFMNSPLISPRVKSWDGVMKCSPVPIKPIQKTYYERTLIVGEAAGQVKATTGGGIYFGLLCAEIAAMTIIDSFKNNNFTEQQLKIYEQKWKEILSTELKAGLILRSIFSRFSDKQIDKLLDLAKRDGIMPIIKNTGFDWHKDIIYYLINHLIPKNVFRGL